MIRLPRTGAPAAIGTDKEAMMASGMTGFDRQQDGGVQTEANDFSEILRQSFKPRSTKAKDEVESAVEILVTQALADANVVKNDILDTIEGLISAIDKKLTVQVNEILHAEEFQKIESAWRGLHHLVMNSETDATLKIRVLNASKTELYRELRQYQGARWDQSPLFKQVYEQEFGQLGGEPFGCLIGDYYFSHKATDVSLLRDLSKVAGPRTRLSSRG